MDSVRIKRPSISLEDIFSGTFRTRTAWLLLFSLPLMISIMTHSMALVALAFSLVAGLAANESIPAFGRLLLYAGRKGADLNKTDKPVIPESLGIAVGAIYLVTMFLFIPVPFAPYTIIITIIIIINVNKVVVEASRPDAFPF